MRNKDEIALCVCGLVLFNPNSCCETYEVGKNVDVITEYPKLVRDEEQLSEIYLEIYLN
jgi:hypothetical protein